MISPFAGFFYSAFDPVLLKLAGGPATRWLTAFFLPHMVVPPDLLLRTIRVAGSTLFVAGLALFFFCAAQVYGAKLRRRGAVASGPYALVRHPQYLALGATGLGLAILWPRFLTLVSWLAMIAVYLLLAKDEERRMIAAHGDGYRAYRDRTGMFLPRWIERPFAPASLPGRIAVWLALVAVTLGGAVALRADAVDHLTLQEGAPNVTAVAILPGDAMMLDHRLGDVLALPEIAARLEADRHYLVYFVPRRYVMQGMIADTGDEWQLYRQHHTAAMILDWIFHPFRHLEGHGAMHAVMMHGGGGEATTRRLIFLSIDDAQTQRPSDLFAIDARRHPRFMADVEVHELRLLELRELPPGTGWGNVPTPTF